MDFIKNFDWSPKSLVKVALIVIVGAIILSIVIALFSFAFRTAFTGGSYSRGYDSMSMSAPAPGMGMTMDAAYNESFSNKLSVDNSVQSQLQGTGQIYSEESDFEVKEYYGTVRTRDFDESCMAIESLRAIEGVVFENANKGEDSCYYSFKILKTDEQQALAIIESLDPESFDARIYTIKKVIENYDTELSILESKLQSVEQSLADAEREYTQLQTLATNARDVENLTKIIDSRLNFISRFTDERMRIIEQINRYNKNKSDQLERLLYSYFTINIYEDKIVDFDEIKDSWKYELQRFVSNINDVLQDVTLNLGTFLMRALETAIYFFVGLFILKFAWVGAKKVWYTSFRPRTHSCDGENCSHPEHKQ